MTTALHTPATSLHRRGLGSAIPWDVARLVGRIERRENGTHRVVVEVDGRRWRIGQAPIAGAWKTLDTLEIANFVLGAIRSEASRSGSWEQAVAPYLKRPDDAYLVSRWLVRFLERERGRCAREETSPNTLRELERMMRAESFAWWEGWHLFAVNAGAVEDWNVALEAEGRPYRMRSAILGEFRRFLRWLETRGEIDRTPAFPTMPRRRKAPRIFRDLSERARVLEAIPWRRRGIFLAMAHTLRPQEARAIDLYHWNAPDLLVQSAFKGPKAGDPIRGLKEDDWRVVSANVELERWIGWRVEQASAEERLRRVGVPLFPNPDGRTERWGHGALTKTWRRALKAVYGKGAPDVPLYAALKHSTATDLVRQGVSQDVLQRFLGHADRRSTDGYVVLAGDEWKGLVRGEDRD